MGLFNYSKPGSGVDKDKAEPLFKIFFDVLFRKFWKFIQLNLIYTGFSLPLIFVFFMFLPTNESGDLNTAINYMYCMGCLMYMAVVGMGFVTPGFTYVLRNFADETHAFVMGDFWDSIKKHFKKGILLFVIDVVVTLLLYVTIYFYSYQQANLYFSFAKYFLICLAVYYYMMHFYIYQVMITFPEMGFLEVMKNAAVLTIGHLPANILLLAGVVALAVFTFSVSIQFGLFLTTFLMVSIIGYLVNFVVLNIIKKYAVDESEL